MKCVHEQFICIWPCLFFWPVRRVRVCMLPKHLRCSPELNVSIHRNLGCDWGEGGGGGEVRTCPSWAFVWVRVENSLNSGSGSGYIHRRSQSMAINATEQGERINCFYIGLHFYLSLPCLLKLCWVVTTIMFKIWLKTLLLLVLFS